MLKMLANKSSADHFETLVAEAFLNCVTGVNLEILERAKRLVLRVHSQMDLSQRREASISALVDTAGELARPYDLDTLLLIITRRARLLLGLDMSYVTLLDEEHGFVYIGAAAGHTPTLSVGLRLPADGGRDSADLIDSAPFWTPDYLADERIQHSKAIDEVVKAEELRAMIAVPLNYGTRHYGSRPLGVLYAADRTVRHFTAVERSLMGSLGDLAAVAIEKAQLRDQTTAAVSGLRQQVSKAETDLSAARELSDTHSRLIELVLSGGDVDALAEEASKRLDGALRIFARNGTVLTTVEDMWQADDTAVVVATMDADVSREPVPLKGGMWAAPIVAGNDYLGTVLLRPNRRLTDRDKHLLRFITQAAAVLLKESSRTAVVEGQDHEELLGDMLSIPPHPPQQLKKRARRLGVDLDKPHLVVIARPEGSIQGRADTWASSYAQRMGGLKSMHNGCAVLLLPGTDAGATAQTVSDKLSLSLGQPVTAGAAGPVWSPESVLHGHQEALRCLDAITALGATGRAASARELGFLGVILSDDHDVEGFIESVIGPVLDYDRQRCTELTHTLDAYFEAGGSSMHAAAHLHVHPNTVVRRLDRIKEVLGFEWKKPARALEIQLALRLFRVRDALPEHRWQLAEDVPGGTGTRDTGRDARIDRASVRGVPGADRWPAPGRCWCATHGVVHRASPLQGIP